MDIVRFKRQFGRISAAVGILLAAIAPALTPVVASAATVTGRSIALSSSVKAATSSYEVKFTVPSTSGSTGAFEIDFCDTPTIGTSCTTTGGAAGLTTAAVADAVDTATSPAANSVKVVLATPVAAGASVDTTLTGIVNPTNSGVAYARIATYTDGSTHYYYTSPTSLDSGGTHLDDGSVALNYTDGFSVGGSVAETMTFCASGAAISDDCVTTTSPKVSLGTNGVLTTTPSTGIVYTKIDTNAVGGAVVSLKSDATGCGGLLRDGTGTPAQRCGISPVTTQGSVTAISGAEFGMLVGGLGGSSSTSTALESTSYDGTHYYMNYQAGDASGVTGPYGDKIFNTSGGPVDQGTANLTFGAAISNLTPAGNYSANFNLIATGTF